VIGFGSSRVVIRQSLSSGFGRIPGALEITWRSPRGNITMSPLSRRTGGSPSAAAQPAPLAIRWYASTCSAAGHQGVGKLGRRRRAGTHWSRKLT